jgi:hypothetical protein
MRGFITFSTILIVSMFSQSTQAETLIEGFGIIQGIVQDTNSTPLNGVLLSALEPGSDIDTIATDLTDLQGRYTLLIPLNDQDSDTVDVNAFSEPFIPAAEYDIITSFLEIDTVDFILEYEAGPIGGWITNMAFALPIENVHVYVEGDLSKSTYSDSTGFYNLVVFEPGSYYVIFSHPEYLEQRIDVETVRGERKRLDLEMDRVIWYVSTSGNDGFGGGGLSDPFATMQYAVDYSNNDDTVQVAPGTYRGSGNRDVRLYDKRITVRAEDGPYETVLDCEGNIDNQHRGFIFSNDEGSRLVGFTISNGYHTDGAGVWCCCGSIPTIDSCIIMENYATQSGGGIAIETSSPTIINCVIRNNRAERWGGGIDIFRESYPAPLIENCTITQNTAGDEGGGINSLLNDFTVKNSILWDDEPNEIDTIYSFPNVSYSDIEGGWEGEGNIAIDPWFCCLDSSDFCLAINSVCVDGGENDGLIGALGVGCDSAGVIMGTVTDGDTGIPLTPVFVEATTSANDVRSDSTDENGHYDLIIPCASDILSVYFKSSGYRDSTVYDIPLVASDTTTLDMEMEAGGCDYVIGDFNHNGELNIADVIDAYSRLRTGEPEPGYVCDCPAGSGNEWAVAMDVNNSCEFNIADITVVYSNLKTGTPELIPCELCPPPGWEPAPGGYDRLLIIQEARLSTKKTLD